LKTLEENINEVMKINSWQKVFVKLSTRSPKDSPIIKYKAKAEFDKLFDKNIHTTFEDKIILFGNLVQKNFASDSGRESIELMISSQRVFEDLRYALEGKEDDYTKFGVNVVIREWNEAVPLENEFRGFVWGGNLNAVGQYSHLFCFPGLASRVPEIKLRLKQTFDERLKPVLPSTLQNCIVDFAYMSNGDVKIIELNPFDCFVLGSFSMSTGLYNLNNPKDKEIIQNGPYELRIKETPKDEKELRADVAKDWINILSEYL